LAILAVGPHSPPRVNVSAVSVVAGFQVIIDGRFWVITEAMKNGRGRSRRVGVLLPPQK
jgi:predicted type IV restriction endonuclease